jgi:hypothetical protein
MARKVEVEIVGDSRNLERAFKRSEQATSRFVGKMTSSFRGVAALLGAGGFVAAAKYAVDAASDLNEQLNRTNVLFGDSADEVAKWAHEVAPAFLISQRAALDFAGAFGGMFESAGQNQQAAARMSETMVQLAGDMASFNNQDPSDMLVRLQSALAGEPEPLRRFSVNVSDAAIKAEAYRDGIAKLGSQLSDQQKIVARYNFILRSTVPQQGDAARTATSLANMMRALRIDVDNLAVSLGQVLVPYIQAAVAWLHVWLGDTKNQARLQEWFRGVIINVARAVAYLGETFGPTLTLAVKFFASLARIAGHYAAAFMDDWQLVKIWWGQFWGTMLGTALTAFRKIIEPFSHLPGRLGGWARKLKDEMQPQLDALYESVGNAPDRATKAVQNRAQQTGEAWYKRFLAFSKGLALKLPKLPAWKSIVKSYQDAIMTGPVPGLPGKPKRAKRGAEKASLLDWLGLAADRAEQTKGFSDDLRVLNRWHAYLRELVKKQGMTFKLARDLFDVETRIADVQKKIADERKKNRKYQQQRVVSSEQVLASLGLRLGPAQERHALQMISMYGRGGGHWRAPPGGRSPAFGAGRGVVVNGDVHVHGVQDIGKLENQLAKRQGARAHVRRGQ